MKEKSLVYSCSGCSSTAQLANLLALYMDHSGLFEMSCIAGVGAKIKNFVQQAQSAERILCIDGCPLNCAAKCLEAISVSPTWHFVVSECGVTKQKHALASDEELTIAFNKLNEMLTSCGEKV